MPRRTIVIRSFDRGINTSINPYSEDVLHFYKIDGFQFSNRLNSLESCGGLDPLVTSSTITYLNGIKRWYRKDGGYNTFITYEGKLATYTHYNKAITDIYTYSTYISADYNFPVLWENCGNILIGMPYTRLGRPFAISMSDTVSPFGGIQAGLLGLDPPNNPTHDPATQQAAFYAGTNEDTAIDEGLEDGTYGYKLTYTYGTQEFPELYGESTASSPIFVKIDKSGAGGRRGIIQITVPVVAPNALLRRVKVYRTLKDTIGPYYYVGLVEPSTDALFNDTRHDSTIDTSKTLPVYTGIATGMICSKWHSGLQRLFWWGWDGYFHWSAAGYPHINPLLQRMSVGEPGKFGVGIAIIRDNIYAFKEDGIFLITGTAPAYVWKRVASTHCVGRCSVIEIDSIVYFLGEVGNNHQVTIFAFDGNSVIDIGKPIYSILGKRNQFITNRAYARSIQGEYWISYATTDTNQSLLSLLPNNILLKFIPGKGWITQSCQTAAFDILDGIDDSGEILFLESEVRAKTNKRIISRYDPRYGIVPMNTDYTTYGSSRLKMNELILGVIPAMSKGTMSGMVLHSITIKSKASLGTYYSIRCWDDAEVLENNYILDSSNDSQIKFESSELVSRDILDATGISAPKWDVGYWGSFSPSNNIYETYKYTVVDNEHRIGYLVRLQKYASVYDKEGHVPEIIDSIELDVTVED